MTRTALAGVLALCLASPALSQETVEQRLDRLEKQNQVLQQQNLQLMQYMQTGGAGTDKSKGPSTPPDMGTPKPKEEAKKEEPKKSEEEKKAEEEAKKKWKLETEGYRIGSDLLMTANWVDGVVFSTKNKDFSMHVGGWMQYDNVWWNQSHDLLTARGSNAGAAQGVLSGASLGGINPLEDGTYFRRIRFMMDGTFWENYEFNLILALENDQLFTIGLDEFWVGAKDVPVLGTVRAGHVKAAHGLEADMTASSRAMTFMERSSYSEAIEGNINFITGLWIGNNYFDQRATWSTSFGRADQFSSTGTDFGDGQYMALGRVTALPLYDCDGRHLMHLGVAGGWFKAQNNLGNPPVPSATTFHNIQVRARPELRDDVPAGNSAGDPNGDSNRLVDTGVIACDSQWQLGTEFLYIRGPFSVQAEYGWVWLENVQGQVAGGKLNPAVTGNNQNYMFNGGYIQLAYTLTGENRSYDKRLGRLDTYYFGRKGPFTNAWFLRDESGNLNWGWGAWELAFRYSYLNLNNGTDLNRIQGGIMDGYSFGLNWYLNTNLKVQFDYVYNRRRELPDGSIPGFTSGFGTRIQFMW
jgi:phosphate-selective porin OprO/OprP